LSLLDKSLGGVGDALLRIGQIVLGNGLLHHKMLGEGQGLHHKEDRDADHGEADHQQNQFIPGFSAHLLPFFASVFPFFGSASGAAAANSSGVRNLVMSTTTKVSSFSSPIRTTAS